MTRWISERASGWAGGKARRADGRAGWTSVAPRALSMCYCGRTSPELGKLLSPRAPDECSLLASQCRLQKRRWLAGLLPVGLPERWPVPLAALRNTHTHTSAYTQTHTYGFVHITHTYTYACMHTRTPTHTYSLCITQIYTHTHTQHGYFRRGMSMWVGSLK